MAELRTSDNQLYEALTLLRGINLLTPDEQSGQEEASTPEAVNERDSAPGEVDRDSAERSSTRWGPYQGYRRTVMP